MLSPRNRSAGPRLDTLIRIQRRNASSTNEVGNATTGQFENLSPDLTLWAECRPLRADEQELAHQLAGIVHWHVIVRDCSEARGVTSADRAVNVNDASKVFNIKGPATPWRFDRRYVSFLAETGGTPG